MLTLKSKMNYDYNNVYDILYITLRESDDTFGHEDEYGIVVNYDYATKEIVGADIWDFKARMESNGAIVLPPGINIDLFEIYKNINCPG